MEWLFLWLADVREYLLCGSLVGEDHKLLTVYDVVVNGGL